MELSYLGVMTGLTNNIPVFNLKVKCFQFKHRPNRAKSLILAREESKNESKKQDSNRRR